MEATLSALSIGALIYGIIKSRQFNDSNDIATVIPPSFKEALSSYQNNPNTENLKVLENMKKKEQNELQNVKNKVQEDANRRIAQILQDAKQQAQRMYAQGKLEEAKNIERLAEQKKSTLLTDTKANLQELGKRFQNTMTTVNTMMSNVNLMSDKNLQKQISLVSNELKTARNNEALLRQQVAQLQSKLNASVDTDKMTRQQLNEYRSIVENAKRSAVEADALRKELNILKSAAKGDLNARAISNQLFDLRKQLDDAKKNEQQILYQLQQERMKRNSGMDIATQMKLQEMERELSQLRRGTANDALKEKLIADLKTELTIAKRNEQDAVANLIQLRNSLPNANKAREHAYELERNLEQLSMNANKRVIEMADEVSHLKDMLGQSRQEYQRLKEQSRYSLNDELLSNAKRQIYQLETQLADMYDQGRKNKDTQDDFKNGMKLAHLQSQLDQMRQDKNASSSEIKELQQQLQNAKAQSSVKAQELSVTIGNLTRDLQQAQLDLIQAKKDMQNAEAISRSSKKSVETLEAQLKQQEDQYKMQKDELMQLREQLQQATTNANNLRNTSTNSSDARRQLETEIAKLKMQIQQQQSNVKKTKQVTNATITELREQNQKLQRGMTNANAIRGEVDVLRTKLQQTYQNSQNVNAMRAKLNAVQRNANSKGEDIVKLQQSLTGAQNRVDELERQIQSQLENAKQKASNCNSLQQQLIKKESDITQLREEKESCTQELNQALEDAKVARQRVFELEQHINLVNSNNQKVKELEKNLQQQATGQDSNQEVVCRIKSDCPVQKNLEDNKVNDIWTKLKEQIKDYNTKFYQAPQEELADLFAGGSKDVQNSIYLTNDFNNYFAPFIINADTYNVEQTGLIKSLKKLYAEFNDFGVEMTVTDLSGTWFPDVIIEQDDVQNTIRTIRSYTEVIKRLLLSTTVYLFTSLDADDAAQLSTNTEFENQIQVQIDDTVLSRQFVIKTLCKFVYIDITDFLASQNNEQYASLYKNYFKTIIDQYVERDTRNCNKILGGDLCKRRYIYIDKFLLALESTYATQSFSPDFAVKSFYKQILLYIAVNIPFIITFTCKLLKVIENGSKNKENFHDELMKLIAKQHNKNMLTYVKVRNDENDDYNKRFAVFVNNDPVLKHTTLVVKYNQHNFPYYTQEDTIKTALPQSIPPDFMPKNFYTKDGNKLTINKYDEEYLVGPFTKVFDQTKTNQDIAEEMEEVKKHLVADEPRPVFIIGYGASGAGKTSTLVYLKAKNKPTEEGVLIKFCNMLGKNYNSIQLKCYEFFSRLHDGGHRQTERQEPITLHFSYNEAKGFMLDFEYIHKNMFIKGGMPFSTKSSLGEVLIHMIDTDRFVKATTNNPNSSRSHSLVFINFRNRSKTTHLLENVNAKRTLIIGDFAGVENAFNCEDEEVLLNFAKQKNNKEQLFYSIEDETLLPQKGGRKSSQRRMKGGAYNAQTCKDVVIGDQQPHFFKLGEDKRPQTSLETYVQNEISSKISNVHRNVLSASTINKDTKTKEVFNKLLDNPKWYEKFMNDIYKRVMSNNKEVTLEEEVTLETMVNMAHEEVINKFANFINNYFENYVNDIQLFKTIVSANEKDIKDTFFKSIVVEYEEKPDSFSGENDTESFKKATTKHNLYDFLKLGKLGIEIITDKTYSNKTLVGEYNNWLKNMLTTNHTISTTGLKSQDIIDKLFNNRKLDESKPLLDDVSKTDNRKTLVLLTKDFPYSNTEWQTYLTNEGLIPASLQTFTNTTRGKVENYYTKPLSSESYLLRYVYNAGRKLTFRVKASNIYTSIQKKLKEPLYEYFLLTTDKSSKTWEVKIRVKDNNTSVKHTSFYEINERMFCGAMIIEALQLIAQVNCKKSYYRHVCDTRRNEGKFINESLKEMRDVIKDLMFVKTKNNTNVTPLYYAPCLPVYCQQGKCFPSNKSKSKLSSIIFDRIREELLPKQNRGNIDICSDVLNDLVIGVFCVINLSRAANNPPPVPYIDTNKVRTILGETSKITDSVIEACRELVTSIKPFLNGTLMSELKDYIVTLLRVTYTTDIQDLLNILDKLDNISAASLIGTLQYVDSLAKFNTTKAICAQKNLNTTNQQLYKDLMNKLNLLNIVTNDKYYHHNDNVTSKHNNGPNRKK